MKQIGLYDETDALARLSQLGDKLEWLESVMDWEIFLPLLDKTKPDRTKEGKGGRPPLSNLIMFKILLLAELYHVANNQMEFQINDRLSWKRFLGMTLSDKAPDATSIWLFREMLTNSGVYDKLFELFNQKLEKLGVITHKGTIVDASFVDVPRQRNTREQNKVIKEHRMPEGWDLPENAHMLAQKDLEAEWAKKNDELHFGYKDHVCVDAESKIITDWRVTGASVHDSLIWSCFIDSRVKAFWADSAYMSAEALEWFAIHHPEIVLHINSKGYRNHPLTEDQKAENRENSRIRARIEHVFGHMTNSMGGMTLRCIGSFRAECAIVMKNLVYNISRYATLCRLKHTPQMS